jgi:hypothetical protein
VPALGSEDNWVSHTITGPAASASTLTVEEAVEPDFERDPSTGKVENDDSARHGWSITEPFSDDERDDGASTFPVCTS